MLAAAPFIIILAAWAADKLWPLPLQEVNPARVVVAQDGTPPVSYTHLTDEDLVVEIPRYTINHAREH